MQNDTSQFRRSLREGFWLFHMDTSAPGYHSSDGPSSTLQKRKRHNRKNILFGDQTKTMRHVVGLLLLCSCCHPETFGFVLPATETPKKSSSQLYLDASELSVEQMQARANFFIWAFGASGAAGIARSAFPRMYRNIQEIRSYKEVPGKTFDATTETVGISPLCGYPRDLPMVELKNILNNKLNVEQIVAKYPVEDNMWAMKGYITYSAFRRANTKIDPLVVRAVFDCFSQSTEVSDPKIAQQKLDAYKESLDNFKGDLLKSKVTGWLAIITLLGLLGLADIESYSKSLDFPDLTPLSE